MSGFFKASCLVVLTDELNRAWPMRDRRSDGWIGDAAHRGRPSDHNPDADGSVNALDADVDGIDVELVKRKAEAHPSVAYWIHAGQIAHRSNGFRPQRYYGANSHHAHVHISVYHGDRYEDDRRPWGLLAPAPKPAPKPTPPPPPQEEDDMALMIRKKSGATIIVFGDRAVPVRFGDDAAYRAAGVKVAELSDAGYADAEAVLVGEK